MRSIKDLKFEVAFQSRLNSVEELLALTREAVSDDMDDDGLFTQVIPGLEKYRNDILHARTMECFERADLEMELTNLRIASDFKRKA